MKELLSNILPYIGIVPEYNEKEQQMDEVKKITVPDMIGSTTKEAKSALTKLELKWDIKGEGETVINQFPLSGEIVNINSQIILYTESQ